MAQPPRPPQPPRPFRWTADVVAEWILAAAQTPFVEMAGSNNPEGLTYMAIHNVEQNKMRKYMAEFYPYMTEPASTQRRIRMVTRFVLGDAARQRFNEIDYPWLHDPNIQPPEDWEPEHMSPELAASRQRWVLSMQAYQQELARYNEDLKRYQNGFNRTAMQPQGHGHQIFGQPGTIGGNFPQGEIVRVGQQPQYPPPQGGSVQGGDWSLVTRGHHPQRNAVQGPSQPTAVQNTQPQQMQGNGSTSYLYGTDSVGLPYWSVLIPDWKVSFRLYCGPEGKYIKKVQQHFHVTFLSAEAEDGYLLVWLEHGSRKPNSNTFPGVEGRLDMGWLFLAAWGDVLATVRQSRLESGHSDTAPTTEEFLEITWKEFEMRKTFPAVSIPLLRAPRPEKRLVPLVTVQGRVSKYVAGGQPLNKSLAEIGPPPGQGAKPQEQQKKNKQQQGQNKGQQYKKGPDGVREAPAHTREGGLSKEQRDA